MEKNDGSSSEGTGDVHQEKGESSAKRIKCSIEGAAFCCDDCKKPLSPPIFQCAVGHSFCSSCRRDAYDLPEDECLLDSCTAGNLARSLGMERAVESILVDCPYAEHGCTGKTAYSCLGRHRSVCPHWPCECPEPGCDFAGKKAELLGHLTADAGHHKWPSTTFEYCVPFDLRIVEPGTQVIHCKNDGQLFLMRVQAAAEPPGFAISLAYVEHLKTLTESEVFQCSVSFSCSTRHRGTSTWHPWSLRSYRSDPPPICVVPNIVSAEEDDAGIVLTVNVACIDAVDEEDDDLDDSSYVESNEDMAMSDKDVVVLD